MKKFDQVLSFLEDKTQTSIIKQIEYNLIASYKSRVEWNGLSSAQKQDLRKHNMKLVKRYRETDGLVEFSTENAIIELYDILLVLKEERFSKIDNNGVTKLRFELLVDLTMDTIDFSPIVKDKIFPPARIFQDLKSAFENESTRIEELDQIINLIEKLESPKSREC